jgi:Domain of unknown function (DUF4129)
MKQDLASFEPIALIFRPLVISGLAACVAASWVGVIESFLPDWQGGYLILLVTLATVETLIVNQLVRARGLYREHRLQIRVAELALILLLLKPLTFLQRGWAALWADSHRWLLQPLSFLDRDYVIGAVVLLVTWPLALDLSNCLAAVQDAFNAQDREQGLNDLKERFMWGALALLIPIALQRVNLPALGLGVRPAQVSASVWLPLAYFGLGLLLFSQTRLTLLQAHWAQEQIEVDPALSRRWAGWGLIFIVGITALALLMPAGDTMLGFHVLVWVMWSLALVGRVLLAILMLLLTLLLAPCMLFSPTKNVERASLPQLPPPPLEGSSPAWFANLQAALFWIVAVIALFFLLRIVWRDRRELGSDKIWQALLEWWRSIWSWILGCKKRVAIRLRRPHSRAAESVAEAGPGWWERWRARTARERVRRLYLTMLNRAAQVGAPRLSHQTPYEYAARLQPRVADEAEALNQLTEAFVQARYSRRDFHPQEISLLHRIWRRVQAALQRMRAT